MDEEAALLDGTKQNRRRISWFRYVLFIILLVIGAICVLNRAGLVESDAILIKSVQAPLNFLAIGDWGRRGAYNQSAIASQMGKIGEDLNIDFVVSTGDNFYKDGLIGVDDIAFEQSFSSVYTAKSLQKPWHAVLGNHDYHGDALAQLDPRLTKLDWRWHCIRDGQIIYNLNPLLSRGGLIKPATLELFFIDTVPFINEYWDEYTKHILDWRDMLPREEHLQQKLQNLTVALEKSAATWKVVVGHHTIRSYGNHGDGLELVERVLPILEANNVDIYLNGHDHCLEHVKRDDSKIHFVVSGGGSKAWKGVSPPSNANGLQFYYDGQGFVSFSVAETWLNVLYYNIYGQLVHKVELSK